MFVCTLSLLILNVIITGCLFVIEVLYFYHIKIALKTLLMTEI